MLHRRGELVIGVMQVLILGGYLPYLPERDPHLNCCNFLKNVLVYNQYFFHVLAHPLPFINCSRQGKTDEVLL